MTDLIHNSFDEFHLERVISTNTSNKTHYRAYQSWKKLCGLSQRMKKETVLVGRQHTWPVQKEKYKPQNGLNTINPHKPKNDASSVKPTRTYNILCYFSSLINSAFFSRLSRHGGALRAKIEVREWFPGFPVFTNF